MGRGEGGGCYENLLVCRIKFWTVMVIFVFNWMKSLFSISSPLRIISSFFCFVNFLKLGIECSIRSNKVWRSGKYRKQSRKKCEGDSSLKWHKHSGLSARPIINLCWFKSDLPTLIFVKRVFVNLFPLEKCVYRAGLNCKFVNGKEFHWPAVWGKTKTPGAAKGQLTMHGAMMRKVAGNPISCKSILAFPS